MFHWLLFTRCCRGTQSARDARGWPDLGAGCDRRSMSDRQMHLFSLLSYGSSFFVWGNLKKVKKKKNKSLNALHSWPGGVKCVQQDTALINASYLQPVDCILIFNCLIFCASRPGNSCFQRLYCPTVIFHTCIIHSFLERVLH